MPGGRELPRDQDLVIRWERHRGRSATALAVIVLLLSFQVFQHGVELLEPLRPRPLVGLHPVVNGLQRVAVEAVQAPASVVAHVDRADLTQHAQVLRHLRLGEPEQTDELVDRALTAGDGVEDLAPPRLGHGVERVGRRRCPCHDNIIYLYRNISTSKPEGGGDGSVEPRLHLSNRDGLPWAAPLVRVLGHADT